MPYISVTDLLQVNFGNVSIVDVKFGQDMWPSQGKPSSVGCGQSCNHSLLVSSELHHEINCRVTKEG